MTSAHAIGLIKELLKDAPAASFRVRLWDGVEETIGENPAFTLVFTDEAAFTELVRTRDASDFAVAYADGRFDIEGDLYAALQLKNALGDDKVHAGTVVKALAALGWKGLVGSGARHSKTEDRRDVQHHYDVSNDFYKLFLDSRVMAYSCAYFHSPTESLEDAQEHKVDLVCRKLRLKAGERLLDIGCGWGGLLIHAAKKYGITGVGVTLSENQLALARERVAAAGLQDKITIELKDYRDIADASFDKIASVGMVEHVGIKNYPDYFGAAYRVLKNGGLFLNHGITLRRAGGEHPGGRFMTTRIFPHAEMDEISHMETIAEASGFEILNVESLRPHYAKTLREWERRLATNWDKALTFASKETCRAWRLYLAGCALAFEEGEVSVFQTLLNKAPHGEWNVPFTPHDVYC
jgi:cyclopropane-fatty-acyl-phospholipid synthase